MTGSQRPCDAQTVIRMNRDTLYSGAVFDLDAGPVTIILPDAGSRFLSMQVISEDQYTIGVSLRRRHGTPSRGRGSARATSLLPSACWSIRRMPRDLTQVHALQDAIRVEQRTAGRFEVPNWDRESQGRVRELLLGLAATLPDTRRMFGTRAEVDPVRHLIGAAYAWGGNPERDALYLNVVPARHDGNTVYRLAVGSVPVDGFWSISLYNAQGYFEANPAECLLDQQPQRAARQRRHGAGAVRRLRRPGAQLPAHHAGLELHGPAVSPAVPKSWMGVGAFRERSPSTNVLPPMQT